MLNSWQSLVIVLGTVAAALLFMAGLNRLWPARYRRVHNDLIGWQLGILGTTYAVILGFMLYTVWTNYGNADLNVDLEANALISLYRMAQGLPSAQGVQVRSLTRSYADVVVNEDWPVMARSQTPAASQVIDTQLWQTLLSVKAASPSEITAEDHALSELSSLSEHRRTRLLQSASRIPTVLWCVLVLGAVVTIASATTFGSANMALHALQVFAFSFMVSLVLVAIADIDRPFQGAVHVKDYAFQRARQVMNSGL